MSACVVATANLKRLQARSLTEGIGHGRNHRGSLTRQMVLSEDDQPLDRNGASCYVLRNGEMKTGTGAEVATYSIEGGRSSGPPNDTDDDRAHVEQLGPVVRQDNRHLVVVRDLYPPRSQRSVSYVRFIRSPLRRVLKRRCLNRRQQASGSSSMHQK